MVTIPEMLTASLNHQLAGRLAEAERGYREIINFDPTCAKAWHFLGLIAHQTGHSNSAVELIAKAIELQPDYAEAYNSLGNVCNARGRLNQAIANYEQAIAHDPAFAEAYNNLGVIFQHQGNVDAAVEAYCRMLELKPLEAEGHYNLANIFQEQGNINDAFAHYSRAIELKTDHAQARHNLSMIYLANGDFNNGWPEYEWRWRTGQASARVFPQPSWDGTPLMGKTILVHAEQGFGDTLQFVRYAAVVKALGATVVFECQRPLRHLLTRCPGIDYLCSAGDGLPPFDGHCQLLSLPGILKTTLETIPAQVPYVFADPALIDQWSAQLAHLTGFRIGINWHGRGGQGTFRKRDVPVEQFVALSALPGLQLIRLQKEIDDSELSQLSNCPQIFSPGDEFDTANGAFMDTAAIMKNLDLVITSDTAIAHLAGALGVPAWVALPFVPDWRWLLDRADSPWYPTMRLFRQRSPGDWAGVFDEIKTALSMLVV